MIPGSGRFTGEGLGYPLKCSWVSLVAQLVKNLPAICLLRNLGETWVRSLGGKIPWRWEWLPAPVFWHGKFHGLYSPCSCKELDMTERLSLSLSFRTDWFDLVWYILTMEFYSAMKRNKPLINITVWMNPKAIC